MDKNTFNKIYDEYKDSIVSIIIGTNKNVINIPELANIRKYDDDTIEIEEYNQDYYVSSYTIINISDIVSITRVKNKEQKDIYEEYIKMINGYK